MVNNKLRIRIQKLKDGRFKITYYWGILDHSETEYMKNQEQVKEFIEELITGTFV